MKWTFPAFVFIVLVFFTASGFAASQGYFFQWQNETGGWVRAASITADGGRVAAGSGDTYAYLFDSDGEEIWRAKTSSYINSVSLSSDGSYLAAASDDTRVYLFDRNGTVKWAYDIGSKGVSLVSLAGDGSYLAAASDHPDNRVYFFNRNGTLLWRYKLGDAVTALTISENGSHIAAGSLDTNIYTFDRDGRILWTYDTGSVGVSSLAISGDGRWVAAGTQYNNLTLINDKGVLNWSVATAGRVKQVFFTKGDSEIAAFTDTDVLEFFSMEGAALFNRSVDNRIKTLALSADGSKIAAGFDKPNIGVYYYALNLSQSNDTLPATPPPEKPKITVLANSIDLGLADDFIAFLSGRGIEVIHSRASEFNDYKAEKSIVVLGGPDAPDGVGEIVQGILTEAETDAIREPGAKKMYVKPNFWAAGQKVIVIAGYDRNLTAAAHLENQNALIDEIGAD